MCRWCACTCYRCYKSVAIDDGLIASVKGVISTSAFALVTNVTNVGVEDDLLSVSTKDGGPNGGFALGTNVK
jgi:hypothetical protein